MFLKAFRTLREFRGESKLSTWLYAITSRLCLNRLKTLRRSRGNPLQDDFTRMSDDSPLPDQALERKELHAILEWEIGRLNDEHRVILILRDIQGLPYEEIAEALGLELGTVRSRLHRARMALKERIVGFL